MLARALLTTAVVAVVALVAPGWAVAGPAQDPWGGTRSELFLTGINQPPLTAGGPAGQVAATLVNRGPSAATNVKFTYTVPAGLTFVSAQVAATACTYAAPTVSCTVANLANGATQPVTVTLSAPGATTPGTVTGSFSPVTSDQYNPAGGNLFRQRRSPSWIGNDSGQPVSGPWPPSNPYANEADPGPTATAPCVGYTNFRGTVVNCSTITTQNITMNSAVTDFCYQDSPTHCLNTWEIIGTYYAPATGNVHMCMDTPDDGAYLNWSNAYDPASGNPTTFTNVSEIPDWAAAIWTTSNIPVVAGRAYRFSIRIANRDQPGSAREASAGGYGDFGMTTVGGNTCSYANFAPPQPSRVTVVAPTANWNGLRTELFLTNVVRPSLVAGGQPAALTATLVNRGPDAATNVSFTYTVPTGLTATAASVGASSCTVAGATVTCALANVANGVSLPVSVTLSAPVGTAAGLKNGRFSPVSSDQFTPAGHELLVRTRIPDWIGNDANTSVPGVWAPSDPYPNSTAPCVNFTDFFGVARSCTGATLSTTVISAPTPENCTALNDGQSCIRTWELIGTYYAQSSGPVTLCLTNPDDGAYLNWSNGYDPASGNPTSYTAVAQTPSFVNGLWAGGPWTVTAGQAYRFSIRVANRDFSFNRGQQNGGFTVPWGLSTVGGDSSTCTYNNFAPDQPANATVRTGVLSITVPATSNLGTVRVNSTLSAQLGNVTVSNPDGLLSWTTTVSATSFTNGRTTIPTTLIRYWSGTAGTTGAPGTYTPGQPTAGQAVTLDVAREAYRLTAGTGANTATWNPTLIITVPLTATNGSYSGTVVHSVA
jgi:uncharacterized repeat protein (TIGR01451 family)